MVQSVQMFWWLGLLQSKVAIACKPLALAKLGLHSSAFCTLVHSSIRCRGPQMNDILVNLVLGPVKPLIQHIAL